MGRRADGLPRDGDAMRVRKPLSTAAIAALNEVLLQAALRAERIKQARRADEMAAELARRMDERARA